MLSYNLTLLHILAMKTKETDLTLSASVNLSLCFVSN